MEMSSELREEIFMARDNGFSVDDKVGEILVRVAGAYVHDKLLLCDLL